VRSHFQAGRSLDTRTIRLYNSVVHVDYITTGSEVESLILESNLIKEHHPEHNIKLKDDKQFPYLRVDLDQPYPRLAIVRRLKRDGARYFGPYTRAGSLRETLRTLRRVFPYRVCSDHKMKTVTRPCLDFHIRRCAGPCAKAVSPDDYRAMMEELCLFLDGRRASLEARLRSRMQEAAADLKFERAAELRDQLRAIQDVLEKQAIISPTMDDQDIVGYARGQVSGVVVVAILAMREGKVISRTGFVLQDAAGQPGPDIVAAFLKQHYGQTATFIPGRVLIPEPLPGEDAGPIGEWLSSLKGRRVVLQRPVRGERGHLVELANQNAAVLAREEEIRREGGGEVAYARAVALGEVLGLAAAPERIEGFDVSNIQGREPVGSMVVFIGGRPAPQAYRRFKVQTKETPDDYAMMQEILYRRFRRLRETGKVAEAPAEYAAQPAEYAAQPAEYAAQPAEYAAQPADYAAAPVEAPAGPAGADRLGPAPDLILIDGGKGHLTVALEVLGDLGIDVPVLALAKEEEMVFLPGRPEPLGLPLNSPASHLLRHVRDEAHRFAVGYHRLLRRKKARRSELDDIPGVGPARRMALLRAFGTTKKIRAASAEELAAVPEVGKAAARRIWEHLHGPGGEGGARGKAGGGARGKTGDGAGDDTRGTSGR
jgi:excinuclease ABC subunit C